MNNPIKSKLQANKDLYQSTPNQDRIISKPKRRQIQIQTQPEEVMVKYYAMSNASLFHLFPTIRKSMREKL